MTASRRPIVRRTAVEKRPRVLNSNDIFLVSLSFIDFYRGQRIEKMSKCPVHNLKLEWSSFFSSLNLLLLLLFQREKLYFLFNKPNHQDQFNNVCIVFVWE
jgi:hypothetical protein